MGLPYVSANTGTGWYEGQLLQKYFFLLIALGSKLLFNEEAGAWPGGEQSKMKLLMPG